ncbi:MAG: glutamate racemase [Mariprofundaceae bacterium]|nr:glutamate racemase [Mariprofundaceae bacterium]
MSNQQPVGVFDSGIGGLSVLRHIYDLLPDERLIYVADSAYMPYGSLTHEAVEERCHRIAGFFVAQGAKALVVACNTATAAAIETLRRDFSLPIIGMEPAVKPAVEATRAGVIGVLATSGTLASRKFSGLVKRFGSSAEVIFQPGSGLVEQVEAGDFDSDKTRQLLQAHLAPLLARGVDVLVLGCTHYPFLAPLIHEIAGKDVTILDTGSAIAAELKRQLEKNHLTASENSAGGVQFFSSGDVERSQLMISRLWGSDVTVEKLGL